MRTPASTPADLSVAEQVSEEGTTLLKDARSTLPLDKAGRGAIAVIGPGASTTAVTAGGGSASVLAAHPVTALEGIRAAVAGRRSVTETAGLPTLSQLQPVPTSDLRPESGPGGASASEATLTAPETGTYELGFSEPPYYVPITLTLDGAPVVVNASTTPRPLYVGTADLVAGHTYTLTGPVDHLVWATPSVIEADLAKAAAAAHRAAVAVVVVSDGQESEAADRVNLALPGDQDGLVEAVARANPRTVVVIDAGAPVTMPWLSKVPAVLDAWYPGEAGGTALAAILFGRADPSGHLPMTFPRSVTADPVATAAQFPGTGGTVQFTEGVDVGYRGFEASETSPLFPFGYGLSYTTFSYTSPEVDVTSHHGLPTVHASVLVTNTGDGPVPMWHSSTWGSPGAPTSPPASSRPSPGSLSTRASRGGSPSGCRVSSSGTTRPPSTAGRSRPAATGSGWVIRRRCRGCPCRSPSSWTTGQPSRRRDGAAVSRADRGQPSEGGRRTRLASIRAPHCFGCDTGKVRPGSLHSLVPVWHVPTPVRGQGHDMKGMR